MGQEWGPSLWAEGRASGKSCMGGGGLPGAWGLLAGTTGTLRPAHTLTRTLTCSHSQAHTSSYTHLLTHSATHSHTDPRQTLHPASVQTAPPRMPGLPSPLPSPSLPSPPTFPSLPPLLLPRLSFPSLPLPPLLLPLRLGLPAPVSELSQWNSENRQFPAHPTTSLLLPFPGSFGNWRRRPGQKQDGSPVS